MKAIHWVTWLLVTVGALNWGLVGAFQFNLVSTLLGVGSTAETVVYILVGVAALVAVADKLLCCKGAMCSCVKR